MFISNLFSFFRMSNEVKEPQTVSSTVSAEEIAGLDDAPVSNAAASFQEFESAPIESINDSIGIDYAAPENYWLSDDPFIS